MLNDGKEFKLRTKSRVSLSFPICLFKIISKKIYDFCDN